MFSSYALSLSHFITVLKTNRTAWYSGPCTSWWPTPA